jgi:hypothetical protein
MTRLVLNGVGFCVKSAPRFERPPSQRATSLGGWRSRCAVTLRIGGVCSLRRFGPERELLDAFCGKLDRLQQARPLAPFCILGLGEMRGEIVMSGARN